MGRLAQKRAVVTGASSGIGRAVAERFAAEGAQVLGVDLQEHSVAPEHEGSIFPHLADVSSPEDWQGVQDAARERWGAVDVLVNSAGIPGLRAPMADLPVEEFDRTWDVNTRGTFLAMKYVVPLMLEAGGGSIVNVGSTASFVGRPGGAGYMSSKSAVVMLTKVAALDYGPNGVRVNCICPGAIETPIRKQTPEQRAQTESRIPLGRLGQPEELAAVALFLASDDASYATGTTFTIDGGLTVA